MRRGAGRRASACALLVCLALTVAGCSAKTDTLARASAQRSDAPSGAGNGRSADGSTGSHADASTYAVADPGPLKKSLLTSDVLVTSTRTIPDSVRTAVSRVPGVSAAMPMSFSSLSANGRTLTIAAADPAEFRRFTPVQSARADAVWSRVAGGEIAVDPSLPRRLEDPKGYLKLGSSDKAPEVHIGAYAPLVTAMSDGSRGESTRPVISAVVDYKRAEQLGMPRANALLVSTGTMTPSAVTGRIKKVLGPDTTLQTLALEFNVDAQQTAVLSGASVSSAVGTFSYTPHPNGTVSPDPRWVGAYIRRETMPIIGSVTGNKGMLPQLRAALDEVIQDGLAGKIHPQQYGGCYVPRYIANDPAKGLSLHSWGMAVDLNVPENERGTVGQMDRQVVAIFKKWGFAWGGDWNYTDPMHFEMDRVVKVG